MGTSLETEGLTRDFPGGRAVDGLTIQANSGEVLALLGPNGAGKTTTVRLLNGVLAPHAGSARVLGLDPVTQGDEIRRRSGVLTENAGLDERLTAHENLVYTARMRGFTQADAARRSTELLVRFGMDERADELIQGASTGQRKRVALARALLHDPELLFLDEPTSGLDPAATRDVLALIAKMATEGRTIVLCTHFLGEAGSLAHRMAVLHRGRLQAFGSPSELASSLWEGLEADIDLGGPADDALVQALAGQPGVLFAGSEPEGVKVRVHDRGHLPGIVSYLVSREVAVYAAVPHPPTLEDVYFEIERRILTEETP